MRPSLYVFAKKLYLTPIKSTTLTVTFKTYNGSSLFCHLMSLGIVTRLFFFRTVLKVTLWLRGSFRHSFSHLFADSCNGSHIFTSVCICLHYLQRIQALNQESNPKHREQNYTSPKARQINRNAEKRTDFIRLKKRFLNCSK